MGDTNFDDQQSKPRSSLTLKPMPKQNKYSWIKWASIILSIVVIIGCTGYLIWYFNPRETTKEQCSSSTEDNASTLPAKQESQRALDDASTLTSEKSHQTLMIHHCTQRPKNMKNEMLQQAQCIIGDTDDGHGCLFLSSVHVAHNQDDLTHLGIDYVVTVAHEKSFVDDVPIDKTKKLHIPIKDDQEYSTKEVSQFFSGAATWIEKKLQSKKNVLVHCSSGISRSSSLVIWYLMMFKKMNLKKAFRFVFDKRPIIVPNNTLFDALREKDKEIYGSYSMNKAMYDVYQLYGILRDTDVSIEECEQAMEREDGNVGRAAARIYAERERG